MRRYASAALVLAAVSLAGCGRSTAQCAEPSCMHAIGTQAVIDAVADNRIRIRVDAINALNNVQWDRPNTSPTSSSFGVVTQQWNTPRWIQVQGRFTF